MKPSFRWTCSYQGCVWFQVSDHTGVYEVQFRVRLEEYERRTLNGPDVVAAEESVIRWLKRYGQPVPLETVQAFNAWQREEAENWRRTIATNPERFGELKPEDHEPRYIAKGSAHWQAPENWKTPEELREGGRWVFVPLPEPQQTAA